MKPTVILTEREVAERLRMSLRRVKGLRLTGKLTYIPGHPVRIFEDDLFAYQERASAGLPAHRFIGPPTAAAVSAKATAEIYRRIRMNAFRRQQARIIKARDAKS